MVLARSVCLLALACSVVLAVPSREPVAGEGEVRIPEEVLSGAWRAELSDSQALLLDLQKEGTVGMKVETKEGTASLWKGKFILPGKPADSQMDWIQLRAGERAIPDNKCLYRLAGDTLLIIGGGPNERPARFYSGPGAEPRTLIFTRVKPATK